MLDLLLETKLFIPPPPAGLVPRQRLVDRLNLGLSRKLTLISAPAGFGKTTLLADWVDRCQIPVAWLALDDGDGDIVRFLTYLVAALRTQFPTLGADALDLIQSLQGVPPDAALIALLNDIAQLQGGCALVLDDIHLVNSQAVHEALAFQLEHQPPQLHLIMSTRADPPISLSRLRAQGQLVEIRAADLRFTTAEAAAFLGQATGLALTRADVEALLGRTEGWAAGLQLAALSMQGREDIAAFIAAFTGSHEYVADYLQDEVLNLQPERIQRFLLQTSVLDQLSGPLCEAVTGESGGQQTLERLWERNLFLVSLDDERRWYRYHRLFADLLRQRLGRTQPELIPSLHQRASEWYEAHGYPGEAIEHALEAGDHVRAARLIESNAEETLMRSEVITFVQWVEQLPDQMVKDNASLQVYYAWALLLSGRPLERVELWLADVGVPADAIPPPVLTLYAYVAILQAREARAAELARLALQKLPEDDRFLRGFALWLLNVASLRALDVSSGARVLDETVSKVQESGNLLLATLALCNLAELRLSQGKLQEAQTIYRRALDLATDAQGQRLPIAGQALIGLGELAREWNDLAEAEALLTEGIALTCRWAEPAAIDGYLILVRVKQALGDEKAVWELLDEAMSIARAFDATELDDWMVGLIQVRTWIMHGQLDRAREWFEELSVDKGDAFAPIADDATAEGRRRKYERLLYARLLLAEDRPAEALSALKTALPILEARGRIRALMEALILMALAYQALGDQQQALNTLARVLQLAEPGEHVRTFVDEGPAMARLLYRAASEEVTAYAGRLLAAFPLAERQPVVQAPEAASIQPLSPREREVLELIAKGRTNQEIAEALVVSLSTVKVHTRNIYQKLDVKNRTQAVSRAQSLGIL